MDYVPIEFISAKTGYKVDFILDLAVKIFYERCNLFYNFYNINKKISFSIFNEKIK